MNFFSGKIRSARLNYPSSTGKDTKNSFHVFLSCNDHLRLSENSKAKQNRSSNKDEEKIVANKILIDVESEFSHVHLHEKEIFRKENFVERYDF